MKSLSPNIFVHDMNQTIEFYQILGFFVINSVPGDSGLVWAMMSCENVTFMFQSFQSLGNELPEIHRTKGGSLLFYIDVESVNTLFEKIRNKVKILKYPERTFYGTLEFSILDPDGYVLTFASDND